MGKAKKTRKVSIAKMIGPRDARLCVLATNWSRPSGRPHACPGRSKHNKEKAEQKEKASKPRVKEVCVSPRRGGASRPSRLIRGAGRRRRARSSSNTTTRSARRTRC